MKVENGTIEFVKKDVNDAFDLLDALRKSYRDCILVHDTDGYHVAADTTKLCQH